MVLGVSGVSGNIPYIYSLLNHVGGALLNHVGGALLNISFDKKSPARDRTPSRGLVFTKTHTHTHTHTLLPIFH